MNTKNEAIPLTSETVARMKQDAQRRGMTSVVEIPDEVFEVADAIAHASPEGPDGLKVPRLREQLEQHRQMTRKALEGLERRVNVLERGVHERARRTNEENTRNAFRSGQHMNGWRLRPLAKAREDVIEAMLEGGERFEQMSPVHIQAYGNGVLDFPPDGQGIEAPDFIVLDALPEVLRRSFLERFAPVASLIRDDGSTPLSLARVEDWQAFAKVFA